jgi:hypothetical protein
MRRPNAAFAYAIPSDTVCFQRKLEGVTDLTVSSAKGLAVCFKYHYNAVLSLQR